MNFEPEVMLSYINAQERSLPSWSNHRLPASRLSKLNESDLYGDEYRRGYKDAEYLRGVNPPTGHNLRERGYAHGFLDALDEMRERAEEEMEAVAAEEEERFWS